jgi:hypothetical protein
VIADERFDAVGGVDRLFWVGSDDRGQAFAVALSMRSRSR